MEAVGTYGAALLVKGGRHLEQAVSQDDDTRFGPPSRHATGEKAERSGGAGSCDAQAVCMTVDANPKPVRRRLQIRDARHSATAGLSLGRHGRHR